MKNRMLVMPLIMLLALSLLAIGCPPVEPPVEPPVVPPEVITWRVQIRHAVGAPGWGVFTDFFVPRIKELSGGRLIIVPFGPGAVSPVEGLYDVIAAGVLDGGGVTSGDWIGKEPAHFFLEGALAPFLEHWQFDAWLWEGGGIELGRELYAKGGIFLVGTMQRPTESLHFRRYTPTLADFAGQKVRTPKGPTAALFKAIGGTPVMLPSGEIYSALDMGLIDAAEWMGLGDNYPLGIAEVTNYFMWPGFHCVVVIDEFIVNMEVWEALPDDLKAIVESATREWSAEQWNTLYLADRKAFGDFIAAGDVHITWPKADWDLILKEIVAINEEAAKKSPLAGRMHESMMAFARALGVIE
ncbi:MAG: Lactate-binding periplasmic protein [Firmicutes bacterium]|nr:Lactate-binding periplasmic protein [Bacillota bacterium]